MRTAALAAVLGLVLAAGALDLAVALLWATALVGLLVLARRVRAAPWLALLACGALLVAGARWGWLGPPAPAPYETGWLALGRGSTGSLEVPASMQADRLRQELRALARAETGPTGAELERQAGAALAFARRAGALRPRAPREVAAVEETAQRLARTLATPEFRDLEGRRRRAGEYIEELDRRLGLARGEADLAAIRRALDPAVMAGVSLRPVREDLAAARSARGALLRGLGGGEPHATGEVTIRIDDAARTIHRDLRYVISVEPPARLLRVEAGVLRRAPGGWAGGEYGLDGAPFRPLPAGLWLDAEGARRVRLVTHAVQAVEPASVRGPLRRIAFQRIEVDPVPSPGQVTAVVGLDEADGLEVPLAVSLPVPPLARLLVPRGALHLVSRPGAVTEDGTWEAWTPADSGAARLTVELTPPATLLRIPAVSAARRYVYRPNLGAVTIIVGLAALTLVLVRRPQAGT